MELLNHTPWPHLLFQSRTPDDEPFSVMVLRGTFRIIPDEPLRPVPDQAPIATQDVHRGEPGSSSLRMESDLAPFKPRTDIHVDAVARRPNGRPSIGWPVRVHVGRLHKDLVVRGPSEWRHRRVAGWVLSEPAPCLEVPIRYENAFGGSFTLADGTVLSYPENPVGSGWIPAEAPKDQPIAAPQLLAPDEIEHRPGQRYAPQSLAPVPPNWEPRLARAGTFDERWLEERWPVLPADFDYSFYQSAHPDLIYPSHVRGDERIELVHFFRDRAALSFLLPGYEVFCLLRFASGLLLPLPAALDTIFIDVSSPELEDHRVSLTWRTCLPSSSIAIAEARMLRPGESPRREAIGAELIETELRRMMHGGA